MKKKILLSVLALMLVITFAFAGGQQGATTSTTAAPGEPQYGGTLTIFSIKHVVDPPSADPMDAQGDSFFMWEVMQEMPLMGDFEKYGPRGTGEYSFFMDGRLPYRFTTGCLVESWDETPERIIMKVREGVHWAADHVDWMDNREFTAEDLRADIQQFYEAPWGNRLHGIIGDMYTTDRYTLVVEFEKYSTMLRYMIGTEDRAVVSPPEAADNNEELWENCVGTGPWVYEELVLGSHASFTPNPDWWQKATIDGKKYDIPFAEKLVTPIIGDPASQIAALRAGKIDWSDGVPNASFEKLTETAPGLNLAEFAHGANIIYLQHNEPPFNDVNVRKALMVGTDIKAFFKLDKVPDDWPLHFFPLRHDSKNVYTEMEDLPEGISSLYDYSPERAKQMLADAGYPNGLKFDMIVGIQPAMQDRAALAKDQWSKIGVEVTLNPGDPTTLASQVEGGLFSGAACFTGVSLADPQQALFAMGYSLSKGGYDNYSNFSDPVYDKLIEDINQETDPDKQDALIRAAGEIIIRDVAHLPISPGMAGLWYWPWLKNYYGEQTNADRHVTGILSYAWIDQSMKKDMGF